ncbi:exonuclease 1 isoform X4 [Macadamia integrifolia]|uniref:exonuclease 1 isoform X4 n=1 Tax=Macadamia integrifolia TaxID=60698 RepID=UPI001C4F4424|nr:exonuclease 1 isoform X4 [Macadamia integrifolia]
MGIHGLLPLLKSIMVPLHIKDLKGLYVAVDTYSWLHKGALSCSKELCKGEPTTRHVDYCMHRVNLLRHYGVKPILVFDGGFLPMKGEQENKRARARKEALERATEHESTGNSAAAYECYQKAVDISPSIAYKLIQVLKQEDIDYIVAPYEADAQMTFLALSKRVDAVITEDSDLIPFGCPRIIFKMDKFGQGVEFRYSMLEQNKELNFSGFNKQMVLEMCILSGCDYLQSLPGMGLKKAHALIRKFKSYEKVIKHLRYNTASVPPLYEDLVKKAILTFQHQRVYDPRLQDMVHLSEIPNNLGDDLHFLGPLMPQDMAKGIAEGDLDPLTKMPFQVEEGFVINGNQLASLSHGLNNEKDVVGNRRTSGLTVSLQQSSLSLCKPCVAHKERDCKSTPAVEGKTRLVSKKVIVRSSYFKHKIMDENDFADKNVKFFAGDTHNGVNDDRSCGSVSSGYNCLEESIGKRKSIPIDSTETESAEVKYTQPHASLPRKSDSVTGFASKFMKVGSEKKFGCNISHLSDYSDIAEKSMENFVSVMSSFRCKSSGSRASGLRAPFRDVQNTCETRSTTASMDLSRFSYVPKNQKTASASHRN